MRSTTLLLLGAATFVTFAANAQTQAPTEDRPTAAASFVDLDGKTVGSATLMDTPNGVVIRAEIEGLKPGELSMHFHQTGQCDPATKFESAGGHFNPANAQHGFMNAEGPHGGDMPNQFVGEDGKLSVNLINDMITIGTADAESQRDSIIDDDGTAIVIHAGADDYQSQPAGNSGDRIVCGVIQMAPK